VDEVLHAGSDDRSGSSADSVNQDEVDLIGEGDHIVGTVVLSAKMKPSPGKDNAHPPSPGRSHTVGENSSNEGAETASAVKCIVSELRVDAKGLSPRAHSEHEDAFFGDAGARAGETEVETEAALLRKKTDEAQKAERAAIATSESAAKAADEVKRGRDAASDRILNPSVGIDRFGFYLSDEFHMAAPISEDTALVRTL
jgi:hypothetical protein